MTCVWKGCRATAQQLAGDWALCQQHLALLRFEPGKEADAVETAISAGNLTAVTTKPCPTCKGTGVAS